MTSPSPRKVGRPFNPERDTPLYYCPVCARELRRNSCAKCGTEGNTASNWIPDDKPLPRKAGARRAR